MISIMILVWGLLLIMTVNEIDYYCDAQLEAYIILVI